MNENSYDAIVVGTGISGGWAAKELTEKGLKTLVLDRGRMVKHGEYPTATLAPWELPYGGRVPLAEQERQLVQARVEVEERLEQGFHGACGGPFPGSVRQRRTRSSPHTPRARVAHPVLRRAAPA